MKRKMLNLGLMVGLLTATLLLVGACVPEQTDQGDFTTSIWPLIIFLVVIFGLMYFIMIRPQRRRQREHDQLLGELRRGDKVITAGGIHGQIETVSEDSVVMKVESGAMIRVAKGSVVTRQGEKQF